jgi:hypothetical protein
MSTVTISREVLAAIGKAATEAVDIKIAQALASLEPQGLSNSQLVRIEALNIASREAVVRSYAQKGGTGKTAVEIAQEMVGFIEELDVKYVPNPPATPEEAARQVECEIGKCENSR